MKLWVRRKLKKEDTVSWDEVLNSNLTSLHGGMKGKSQGAQVYMVKCQELGVVPSTQVRKWVCVRVCMPAHQQRSYEGLQSLMGVPLACFGSWLPNAHSSIFRPVHCM